ncbi:serine hydrolase domain-containing protein [Maricaulis salignorans]|uniref:CubicO group peptidase, beta-lactamase class C family n=1 Tax=Maricaulis salignorans TaxID=144026 RepID=A0A1G9RZK9_9PROT|nr:serine hydrolase domain-containing protein [Maricaulis salignorans]SDM28467.1 CubicO group peptidase, beta-lactamase class C family [Maricaulis salignorans]
MLRHTLAAISALLLTGTATLAETPQVAAAQLDEFLDRFPDLGPGFAVVIVTADDIIMNRTQGERRAATGAPMTSETPIYIASQTKAYMGLLAAYLDAQGILALDSHITDYWPDLQFPEGVDPAEWTLRDLISHQVPISVEMITILEAYVGEVAAADYPALIARYGEAREPGFEYDNLGYNIYGAILETATGRSWQDWLDQVIFDPLGMDHTSARTSDFSLDELSWGHVWQGEGAGWYEVRPKTDAIMQSAGGLVTSTDDMAQWLQLQLRGSGPEGSGITAGMIADAQTVAAETHRDDRRNAIELVCSGYALGWNVCDFEGHPLYVHGGGYTGIRTMMAFAPDLGVGIATFSNSDNMTGWVTSRTVIMYLQFLTEHADAERWSEARPRLYPERAAWLLNRRQESLAETCAEARWGDWSWTPDSETLAAYQGRWSTGDPYLDFEIALEAGQLVAHWGVYTVPMQPATPDVFGGQTDPSAGLEYFHFSRDESGALSGVVWDEHSYTRIAGE